MILAMAVKFVNLNHFIALVSKEFQFEGCFSLIFLGSVDWIKWITSAIGLLFRYYGVLLVLAAILSIVRMQLFCLKCCEGNTVGYSKTAVSVTTVTTQKFVGFFAFASHKYPAQTPALQ